MRQFESEIHNTMGIYGNPAGLLSEEAAKYDSVITIRKGNRSADLVRLMPLLEMGVRCGDVVTVTIEGRDEEGAEAAMKAYFIQHL